MLRKATGVLALAAAALAVGLVAPSAALACNNDSASCIYSDGGVNASGKSAGPGAKPRHVPKKVDNYLKKAGKDAAGLHALIQQPNLGTSPDRKIAGFNPNSVAPPSALAAVFDLGAGPVALIAVLIGSALALLAASGWRGWRRWRGGRLAA